MAVTIAANGLSIVHKGSGGEANASVPDVCLTKVGKPVVPIPYGNNAKSSDLVDGSTTVFADGGNSIALQGSKFSKSTGDAGGDKKGVSSGTIEAEAQFVTSSPTVLIEGKGVARQTDQMTMNKANTMCFGVQNPSVSVDEDLEETHDLEVSIRYPNGKRLTNAPFELINEAGAVVGSGTLDGQGKATVTGLKPDKVKLVAEESQDDLVLKPLRRDNPHYQESVSDEDFFELATKGQRGFWQPTRVDTHGTAWGCMGTNLSEDKFFQDIIETEIKMHFSHFYASNEYDFDKVCASALCHLRQPLPHTTEALLARTMPHALEEGDILSTILCLDPRETSDRMLAYIRGLGQGNPKSYLERYDWEAAKKTMNKHFESLDKKVRDRVSYLRDEARKEYAHLEDILNEHLNKLDAYSKAKSELISNTFNKLKSKATKILDDIENVKVNNDEGLVSTESREVTSVVNAIPEVSVALPAPEKIAGVIQDKIPIYPVRYGYANVFEDPMPAQAPPTMIEMSQASSLKETGGYILRLLCEGWIYIKEEGDSGKRACHIFKYLQTETPNGVLERFEKYNFTNGKNAQDGLTLDTSSGSDFYPFAFVNAQTQEISIAYSAHEWAESIIDKMNEDEEFRQKAMQRVDLTSSQTDFSVEATEENLGSMVEDYRPTDNKWFKAEKSSKPTDMGLELFTTQDSYPLSPEGIVETMQKSHSEKKNGVLVALYDPVGRQADITFLLTMIFTIEKSYEASRVYPKTIGDMILHLQKSGKGGPLEQSINKYINLSELNKFYKENKTFAKEISDRRKEILKLYSAFSYLKDGEEGLADGSLGSLNAYFEHYFDSQNPKDLIKEMEKLSKVMKVTLEGLESSEEGKEIVYFMVSDEASGGAYGIFQDHLKVILLQCQDNVDWADVTNVLLKNTANVLEFVFCWVSSIAKYTKEGTITSAKILRPKLYGKLLSFIPIIFEKGYGIKEIKGEVKITLDKLAEILAKNIDSKGKNDRPIKRTLSALDKGTKLINWANDEWKHKMPHFEEIANKANLPEIVVPKFGGRYTSFSANSTLELLGSRVDGAISMVSLKANIDVLVQITQNDRFDVELDPATGQLPFNFILNYSDSVAALSAGITDTIGVLNSQLIFQRRLLNSFRLYWALRTYLPKLLAVSSIGVTRLLTKSIDGRLLVLQKIAEGQALSRLVAISSLAVMVTAGVGVIDAYETGDRDALNGHIYTIMGSTFVLAAPFRTMQNIAVSSRQVLWLYFFAMMYLLAADNYKRRAHKSDFEELLYRCFWGNSNKYAFWHFENRGKFTIPQRIEKAAELGDNPKYKLALEMETQEFYNYSYMPRLYVEVVEEISRTRKRYKYIFTLPHFKLGESNVVAAVYNKGWIDPRRPAYLQQIQKGTFKVNEEATKAFAQAFAKAETGLDYHFPSPEKLADPDYEYHLPSELTVQDVLANFQIIFEVEMDNPIGYDLELHWYYEQSKDLTVPKRRLTKDGRLLKTYLGMIDGKLADYERDL